MTRSAKGCGETALFKLQGCLKWVELTIQRTKDGITEKGENYLFDIFLFSTLFYFFPIKFQHIFLAKTEQSNFVKWVLYYTRNKTLLLGTSLYTPYGSEVHFLNQHYL